MAFSFAPTYQDYLAANPQLQAGSEGGSFSGLTQDQWNALGAAGQWQNIGSGIGLSNSDPRYAALAQQLGITDGGVIQVGYKPQSIGINGLDYVDPSHVLQGDDVFASAHSNLTPFAQKTDTSSNWFHEMGPGLMIVAAMLSAGAAAGAMGVAAEGAGGAAGLTGSSALTTGGFGTDIAAGSGAFGAAASGAGSLAGQASGGGFDANGVWHDVPQMDPVQAGTLNPMGPDATPLGSSNSSFLHNLNTGRQYFNGARSVMNLLSGGQGRSGGTSMPGSTDSSGNWLTSLLGLLAGGHQAFGGGVGTASGAQDVANHASQLADPWGSSGDRANFMNMLTPDMFMKLTSQDPSAILSNPAYQFDLNQGINAINQGDAAQGTLRSGNRGYELEQYGQGLASKYGQQYLDNNMRTLQALSGLAGVNQGSPAASAQALVNGFDNASNLRNAGTNSLFSGGSSNGLLSLLSSAGGGISGLLGSLFGGSSTGLSSDDITSLLESTNNTGISDDLFNSWLGGATSDTGISDDLFNSFMGGF